MRVVLGQIIRNAGQSRVHISAAQIFSRDNLAGGRFDQRRAREKDRALLFDDDRDIRHGRHIGPTRGARPHDHSNLRDTFGGHLCLIVKNTSKVVPVGKDFVLIG